MAYAGNMATLKGLTLDTPAVYRIGVQGFLDESWCDRMKGVDIQASNRPDEAPVTLLVGCFIDQAALAGVLNTLYDLGYPLLTVELLEAQPLGKARTPGVGPPEKGHAATHLERRTAMALGPIDFLALEFPGNKFDGSILTSLLELVQAGVIRIIDLVVIVKDQDGRVIVRELQELDPDAIRVLDPLDVKVTSMITRNDIDLIAAQLANSSAAGLLLFENLWAIKTKQAMLDADARVVMFERIPHEVVEENLAEMAGIGA
jgi:hypothetical protein